MPELLRRLEDVAARGAGLRSLVESFDSRSEAGRLAVRMVQAVAGVERTGARERLQAGIKAARRQQTPLGRPPALSDEEQDEMLRAIAAGEHSCSSAARMFGVSPATISRLVRRARDGGT